MFNKAYLKLKTNNPRGVPDDYTYFTEDSIAEVMALGYFDFQYFEPKEDPRANLTNPSNTGFYRIEASTSDGVFAIIARDGEPSDHDGDYRSEVIVTSKDQLADIDPTILYRIDGIIDAEGQEFEIPAGGFNFAGSNINVSGITCSVDNYTMFKSAVGGSGNIVGKDCFFSVTGANSKVYDLTGATGLEAFEFNSINYTNCTSIGEITDYRQGLEVGTGRLGGTPELTLSGDWSGYRISTSIAFNMTDFAALFKAGTGLTFNGRFITDINCDLPTSGALFDFSESNIVNDESLIIDGSYVTRNGVQDASDTTIYPNIDHTSVKSNWGNNSGMPNTKKYIKAVCTSESATLLSGVAINNYLPLAGTLTVAADDQVQLSSPVNGQFELLTGNGLYSFGGTIQLKGTAGDLIDLRVTKSSDNFATAGAEINHIQLEIANLAGPTDFATYSINFNDTLKKGDRVRLEVENKTGQRNVTMATESYFIITEV